MDQADERVSSLQGEIERTFELSSALTWQRTHARLNVQALSARTRELMAEEARIREALTRVQEILSRNPAPDTFLGRQTRALIPLPHERED